MLKRCIKTELKKALKNKITLLIFALLLALVFSHIMSAVGIYNSCCIAELKGEEIGNPTITVISVFIRWLGADVASFESNFFYFILPIVAALPFGWSLAGELSTGYTRNVLYRVERKTYFLSKYIAVLVSGAIIVLVPLLLDFGVLSMILPSIRGDSIYPYGVIGEPCMWSNIYFEHPLLYVIMYILLDALFAGLIASISTASAFFIKQKLAVILLPFFIMLFLDYLNMAVILISEFSPMKFLRALPTAFDRYWWVVLLETVILLAGTLGVVLWRERKYEIL